MLSHFANLVKTNQFKIRSKRVISELDTWIFKNGRIDHKDGCHDDTLTCLAIGLFVIQYSMNKQLEAKQKDAVILQSMINLNNRIKYTSLTNTNNSNKKFVTPIYTANSFKKNTTTFDANMWLFK
jgi:hypothetical protein